MKDNTFGVALTKCYFCGEDNEIVINKWLTERHAKQVEQLNGKVISTSPCSKCKEHMTQGIIIITINSAKSDPEWWKQKPQNPYRTGGFFVVTEKAIREVCNDADQAEKIIQKRVLFMEHDAAIQLGLFEAIKG